MNTDYLRYFSTLAELQHYGNAAKELNISQPGLSHAIHSLEKDYGLPLFEKTGRNVRLSPYGLEIKKYIDVILNNLDELEQTISDFHRVDKIIAPGIVNLVHALVDLTAVDVIVGHRKGWCEPCGLQYGRCIVSGKSDPGIFPWIFLVGIVPDFVIWIDQKGIPGLQCIEFSVAVIVSLAGHDVVDQVMIFHAGSPVVVWVTFLMAYIAY